jgi:hypothetical protein
MIIPKTRKEAVNLIREVLNQGDDRYNAIENEVILSNFLAFNAITLEKREIPFMEKPKLSCNLEPTLKVQMHEKLVAIGLLKLDGFNDKEIILERKFLGSRPDILAKSATKSVIVECCSCRVDKIIDFLKEIKEVWIITRGFPPWENSKNPKDRMQLFIFQKGLKWEEIYNSYNLEHLKDLKQFKGVFD